jgi:hypothetical protein
MKAECYFVVSNPNGNSLRKRIKDLQKEDYHLRSVHVLSSYLLPKCNTGDTNVTPFVCLLSYTL